MGLIFVCINTYILNVGLNTRLKMVVYMSMCIV